MVNIITDYIFAYHGGERPKNPEDGAKQKAKFRAWIGSLGNAVVNPGTPLGMSKIGSINGTSIDGGQNPLIGFSIIKADGMGAALEITKECPYLEIGTIEVAEVKEM